MKAYIFFSFLWTSSPLFYPGQFWLMLFFGDIMVHDKKGVTDYLKKNMCSGMSSVALLCLDCIKQTHVEIRLSHLKEDPHHNGDHHAPTGPIKGRKVSITARVRSSDTSTGGLDTICHINFGIQTHDAFAGFDYSSVHGA